MFDLNTIINSLILKTMTEDCLVNFQFEKLFFKLNILKN